MAMQAAELKLSQPGAAQREPSMEEILASIRRIIEDSDQTRKPEAGDMLAPVALSPAGLDREAPAEIAPAAPTPAVSEKAAEPPKAVELPKAAPAMVAEPIAAPFAAARPVDIFAEATASLEDISIDIDDEIDAALPPAAANNPGAAPQPRALAGAALISERTGRQVAAAFEELSDAFAENRRKRFDDMAAEMMRPMLQDWLDNNLPMLVEKLVREEIERIARGAAR